MTSIPSSSSPASSPPSTSGGQAWAGGRARRGSTGEQQKPYAPDQAQIEAQRPTRQKRSLLGVTVIAAGLAIVDGYAANQVLFKKMAAAAQEPAPQSLATEIIPDRIAALPNDKNGRQIWDGWYFLTHTPDAAPGHVGNGMSCVNCHHPGKDGLVGTNDVLPLTRKKLFDAGLVYIPREGTVESMEKRALEGCMQRSESGVAYEEGSKPWKDIGAYFDFIASDHPENVKTLKLLDPLPRAADLKHGKEVFHVYCESCHGPDGQGRATSSEEIAAGYPNRIPGLWGPRGPGGDSGMGRERTLAAFAEGTMPRGIQAPILSDEEATDVAGFIANQPHRHMSAERLALDYPGNNIWLKPPDSPYGRRPPGDPFPEKQHKDGPWQPIINWVKTHKP